MSGYEIKEDRFMVAGKNISQQKEYYLHMGILWNNRLRN